ncbi:S53 family peptidase [Mucilaginibacter sp. E4BP6]|uniref:S53 family peptidase n=1 Tax=Mucilaginibacter sp. E4BP6 TaxID=2723089 RepID=UPI0015C7FD51|nr:S53 family peptidase [Mucilaginibacter sp. E4BP6]NYE65233.1 kumamolisin [Mucilaginibacter sp. E4BP6]
MDLQDENITVTIRLRRKKDLPTTGELLTREQYLNDYSSAQEDAEKVESFAHQNLLSTAEINLARRSIMLTGKLSDFETAFNIKFQNQNNYRTFSPDVQIPDELKDIIVGIFGLQNKPIARPMFQVAKKNGKSISHAQAPQAFTPDQLSKIYGFPQNVNGSGECIAIIELGGGFRTADIANYFKNLNITAPKVKAIAVDGGKNSPTTADGADGEVMLDIEVAGAVASGANIVVYFTPNTDQGFLDAITTAIHDTTNKPSVISISWGSAEVNWTQQAMDNFNEAFKTAASLGVSICIAAGDSGSSDGETDGKVHVDFPASSPYALACGGTSLTVTNNVITSEVVWHDSNTSASGGGVSSYFPLPDYQASANVPLEIDTQFKGRGVPDVAADADPDTGYKVLVDGQQLVIGGTSAVAPLMAGLIALLNQQNGKPSGFIHSQIYGTPNLCRDITSGNNKTTSAGTGYTAGTGWDACSGLGVLSKL